MRLVSEPLPNCFRLIVCGSLLRFLSFLGFSSLLQSSKAEGYFGPFFYNIFVSRSCGFLFPSYCCLTISRLLFEVLDSPQEDSLF